MGIYRSFLSLILFGLAAASMANAAGLEDFPLLRHIPADIMSQIKAGSQTLERCFITANYLMCVQGKNFPGVSSNSQARQAVLNGLGVSARNSLYNFAVSKAEAENLKDGAAVRRTVNTERNKGNLKLRGMEFSGFCKGNWCAAIAALPYGEAAKELPKIYASPAFINAYCRTLMPEAVKLMEEGKYKEALLRLKELHDLKFADIDAYLLACRAFIVDMQANEAKKIALELLNDFPANMNAAQAEELGDIFIELKLDTEAEKAYKIAGGLLELSAS